MKRIFFLSIVFALAFGLALSAAPLGAATAQAGEGAEDAAQIKLVKLPPGYAKAAAENRAARQLKTNWSPSLQGTAEEGFLASAVFKDHLYVTFSRGNDTGEGLQVFRTADGEKWETASQPAFGNQLLEGLFNATYAWSMVEFKGMLYIGMGWWAWGPDAGYLPQGGQVWRTADGLNWEKVVDLAGDPFNEILNVTTVFQGQIYGATNNFVDSFEVWRSPTGNAGDWTKVADNSMGLGLPAPGVDVYAFNQTLFVSPGVIYNIDYSEAPFHLWSSQDGVNFQPVTLDGFGDPRALYGWTRMQYKGSFYIQTQIVDPVTYAETVRVMRTHDGVNWSVFCEDCRGLGSVIKGHAYQMGWDADLGLQVYRSADLLGWEKVEWQGFDAPGMTGGWGPFAIFKGDLYFVVYDESGNHQLWRMSAGGK